MENPKMKNHKQKEDHDDVWFSQVILRICDQNKWICVNVWVLNHFRLTPAKQQTRKKKPTLMTSIGHVRESFNPCSVFIRLLDTFSHLTFTLFHQLWFERDGQRTELEAEENCWNNWLCSLCRFSWIKLMKLCCSWI